jgi:urease accessory protein
VKIQAQLVGPDLNRLARLLQFADSTLPVGAFSFSQGLESAVQLQVVHDAATLKDYLTLVLRQAAYMDGVALLNACRAASRGDYERVVEADHALWIRRVGEEQQMMLARMGKKFAELAAAIAPSPMLTRWLGDIRQGATPGCFPVAQAIILDGLGAHEAEAFTVHQYGLASMVLNAALRLMRIDHVTTQRLLFDAQSSTDDHYRAVRSLDLEEMSGFAPMFEIVVAHHTRTHLRLFMN